MKAETLKTSLQVLTSFPFPEEPRMPYLSNSDFMLNVRTCTFILLYQFGYTS